jgi:hypothetical protein
LQTTIFAGKRRSIDARDLSIDCLRFEDYLDQLLNQRRIAGKSLCRRVPKRFGLVIVGRPALRVFLRFHLREAGTQLSMKQIKGRRRAQY